MSFWSSFGSGLRRVGQGLVQSYQPVFKPSFRTPGYNPAAPLPFSQDQTIDPPDPLTAFGDPNTNRNSAQAQEWDSGMDAEFDYGSYQPAAPAGEGLGTISFAAKYDGGRRGQDSMPMRPARKALAPYQGEAGAAATADPDDVADYPTNTSPWNPSRVELSFPGAPSEQSKVGSATRRYLELLDRAPQERMRPKSTLRTILGGVAGAGLTLAGGFGLPPSIARDLTNRVTYGNDTLNRRKDYEEQLGAAQLGSKIEMEHEKTDQARELKLAQMQAQQARFTLGQLGIQHRADEANLARYMNQGAYALPDDYQAGAGFMNAQFGTNFPGADLRGDQVLNKGGIKKQIGGVTLGIPTREQRVGTEARLTTENREMAKRTAAEGAADDRMDALVKQAQDIAAGIPYKDVRAIYEKAIKNAQARRRDPAALKGLEELNRRGLAAQVEFSKITDPRVIGARASVAAAGARASAEGQIEGKISAYNKIFEGMTDEQRRLLSEGGTLQGASPEVKIALTGANDDNTSFMNQKQADAMQQIEAGEERIKSIIRLINKAIEPAKRTSGPAARLQGLKINLDAFAGNNDALRVAKAIIGGTAASTLKEMLGGMGLGAPSDTEHRMARALFDGLGPDATIGEYETTVQELLGLYQRRRERLKAATSKAGKKAEAGKAPGNAAALKVETRTSAQAKALAAAKNMTVGQLTEALAAKGVKLVIKD